MSRLQKYRCAVCGIDALFPGFDTAVIYGWDWSPVQGKFGNWKCGRCEWPKMRKIKEEMNSRYGKHAHD